MYLHSDVSETACRELYAKAVVLAKVNDRLMQGYSGAAAMMMAKFVVNPVNKFVWFRKGRKLLDEAIRLDKDETELRYLRFCIQTHCPGYLGYHGEVGTDRVYLLHFLRSDGDPELQEMVGVALKEK